MRQPLDIITGAPDRRPWRELLAQLAAEHRVDERTIARLFQEADFAQMYATAFNHGTDGHIRLMLIALLCEVLNLYDDTRQAHASDSPQL